MEIRLGGEPLYLHTKYDDIWEENMISLESFPSFEYAPVWQLEQYGEISQEGLVWDAMKTAVKAPITLPAKAGKAAYKGIKKGYVHLDNNWTKFKPLLIKMIREMANNMSLMWNRFMKYDQKYIELGKKIREILQTRIHMVKAAPGTEIFYHQFDPNFVKAVVDKISDFDAYWNEIKEIFFKEFPDPVKVSEYLKNNNQQALTNVMQAMSEGMAKLNEDGEFTIMNQLDKRSWVTKKVNNTPGIVPGIRGRYRDINNGKKDGSVGVAEFLSTLLLGKEVSKYYKPGDVKTFTKDMSERGGFLDVMSSILNNAVLANALKSGGGSMKKVTDTILKEMDAVIKEGLSKGKEIEDAAYQEKRDAIAKQKEVTANAAAAKKEQNPDMFDDTTGSTFKDDERQLDIDQDTKGLSTYAEEYANAYSSLLQKAGYTYVSITRGLLQATFTLVKEAWNITNLIESQIGG